MVDLFEDLRRGQTTAPLCVFELPGQPRAWERAGVRVVTPKNGRAFASFYDPKEQAEYKQALAWRAKAAMRGREPFTQALAVAIYAMMPIRKSWSDAEKDAATVGTKQPTGTPDWDNLGKVVGDACNKLVWNDDSQIIRGLVIKEYGESPGLIIEVYDAGN